MKTIVILPTYNEKENIKDIITAILNLKIPNLDVLVVDDNSPDKTWQVVKDIKNKKVSLLQRKKDKGRGYAGIEGFNWAIHKDYDYIIEMDADFSHDPRYIPRMIGLLKKYDIILGSRFVKGGKDTERSVSRRLLTRTSINFVNLILGMDLRDPNSGYRAFRKKVISDIIEDLNSTDADIVQEVIYKSWLKGFKIKEIPIVFIDRKKGETTKNLKDILRGLFSTVKLRIDHSRGRF